MIVLQQILVGKEYRYRDEATGHVFTAEQARRVTGPCHVKYLPTSPFAACGEDENKP